MMRLNPFYAICLLENFPLSLHNNASYHVGDFFYSSINSSFTHNPEMTTTFIIWVCLQLWKSYFQEDQTATAILLSVWNAYVGQMLQWRSFLCWVFFWFSKRRENEQENWHHSARKISWQLVLRVITKIRRQKGFVCSSEGLQDSRQAKR